MNFMFIRARYNYIQLIILQRIEGKARFLYSLPFPPSSNGMKWYAMILILIAIPADANFLNGYALNGPVLVGYVLKIRIGGICIGGIRLRFLLMHTFWMDTHWMDTHSMDTYWWDTCWTDTYWWDTYCKTCWCKRFERITLHGYVLVGYVLNGYVLVGYVLVGYVLNGYVWDMCGVMDMCGICVVWDMCGICVVWDMCGICVAWDMCGICVVWDTPTIFWRTLRRNVFRELSSSEKKFHLDSPKKNSPLLFRERKSVAFSVFLMNCAEPLVEPLNLGDSQSVVYRKPRVGLNQATSRGQCSQVVFVVGSFLMKEKPFRPFEKGPGPCRKNSPTTAATNTIPILQGLLVTYQQQLFTPWPNGHPHQAGPPFLEAGTFFSPLAVGGGKGWSTNSKYGRAWWPSVFVVARQASGVVGFWIGEDLRNLNHPREPSMTVDHFRFFFKSWISDHSPAKGFGSSSNWNNH